MSATDTFPGRQPIAGQIWPAPITAQAAAELDRALLATTEEANEVLLAYVIGTPRRARAETAA